MGQGQKYQDVPEEYRRYRSISSRISTTSYGGTHPLSPLRRTWRKTDTGTSIPSSSGHSPCARQPGTELSRSVPVRRAPEQPIPADRQCGAAAASHGRLHRPSHRQSGSTSARRTYGRGRTGRREPLATRATGIFRETITVFGGRS